MNVLAGVKGLLLFWNPPKPAVPFSVLFKKFKSILERNNRILELMADMGDKLGGEYVFDRQYIMDACEKVSDLVFKLISDLSILTGGKNVELFIAFEHIQHDIQEELAGRRAFPMIRQTILLEELNSDLNDEVGNKFANLGDIGNVLGLPTPDGFVITTKAFFDFMEVNGLPKFIAEALEDWDGDDEVRFDAICTEVRNRILTGRIPRQVTAHIESMLDVLASRQPHVPLRFAVRSSAWGEDSEFTFAGQYESVLNVPRKEIPDAYRRVIAGAYTPQAWHYRLHRGFRESELAMAVGCQIMAGAEVSGALYTYAPLPSEKEAMAVSAAWGLGPAVVEGIAESDTFILDRSVPHTVLSSDIGHKAARLVPKSGGGIEWMDIPEERRDVPCLTDEQVRKLAEVAMVIERYYRRPQDVEWAFDSAGNLHILQSRPLNVRSNQPEVSTRIGDATRASEPIFAGKGTVVQGGVGSGKAYVVKGDDDLTDFPYGAILVAPFTSPKYSRIMRKAQGIVTDVGSATGHMAALAREYRVPTVVDTGIATSLIRTGDEITLDACVNAVYRGRVWELSRFELTEREVFEESYEYRLLKRLLKKITPLNLLDPHGDDFKPNRCRTFHDITRYIHEKAVGKLIDLSENYQRFHDTTPRRLESALPLGLMVIDVEGGAEVAPGSRTIEESQIVSVPMKALLEGMSETGMWATAPAPVDLGSFMSSITRTFSASMATPGAIGRNLAVISREYMNLNLRLGYHFNIVDAYIGDVLNDNTIYFRFLGGVTEVVRRSRRARFIAEVLENLDFRVEVHGDLVVGRVKKMSKSRMICRMKILGALIGYTRQLDVSMNSDEQVGRHVSAFMEHIRTLREAQDECSR